LEDLGPHNVLDGLTQMLHRLIYAAAICNAEQQVPRPETCL